MRAIGAPEFRAQNGRFPTVGFQQFMFFLWGWDPHSPNLFSDSPPLAPLSPFLLPSPGSLNPLRPFLWFLSPCYPDSFLAMVIHICIYIYIYIYFCSRHLLLGNVRLRYASSGPPTKLLITKDICSDFISKLILSIICLFSKRPAPSGKHNILILYQSINILYQHPVSTSLSLPLSLV